MAARTARRSSFLAGAARAFDPGAVLRGSRGRGAAEADMLAMRSDWEAVGEDLWRALDTLATPREASRPVADENSPVGGGDARKP